MAMVTIHEAKTQLSALLIAVERGEHVVIARDGTPVARLVRLQATSGRQRGEWRALPNWERFACDPTIFAPMTEAESKAEGWE